MHSNCAVPTQMCRNAVDRVGWRRRRTVDRDPSDIISQTIYLGTRI